ncbi:MAG: tRNA-binding protein [Candidatus Nanohaloarchaea archaeon]
MPNDSALSSDIRVGRISEAEEFEKCEKPKMAKLWIQVDNMEYQSAAQLLYNHDVDNLEGKKVLCAMGTSDLRIAGFKSEVLTLGVPDEKGNPVLVSPDDEVPLGGRLY